MNAPRFSLYARIALVAAAAGVMTACAPVRDHHRAPRHHTAQVVYQDYWYYPAIGAYYDPRVRIYLYFEHNHWVRARTLPARLHAHSGRHVIVRSRHDRPYEDHHRHRQQYTPERQRRSSAARRGAVDRAGEPHFPTPQRRDDRRRPHDDDRDRVRQDRQRSGVSGPAAGTAHRRAPEATPKTRPAGARSRDASGRPARAERRDPASQQNAPGGPPRHTRPQRRTRDAGEYRRGDRQGNAPDRRRSDRRPAAGYGLDRAR